MAQDILYTLKKRNKGFAALFVIILSATLAIISYKVISYGRISLNVFEEKQLLDTCSINAGQSIISTNDIENVCSAIYLNRCVSLINEDLEPNYQCRDLGLECNADEDCVRRFSITSTYDPGQKEVVKSVDITIPEETHDVEIVDAAVIMLLDFSGSMAGNRIVQLKNTVRQFIDAEYNLSYSVILYNSDIIVTSNIGKGALHKQSVHNIINSNNPNKGTNFVRPLEEAMTQISQTNYEAYYILLISDGSPNEGSSPSQSFVQNNIMNINDNNCIYSTSQNPCISVYTLGVDNADTSVLESLSGNTLNTNASEYSYVVNANQVAAAFSAIIEEIMCKIGPITINENFHVFNGLDVLEENIDYIFDSQYNILKFYDEEPFNVCTQMLDNNALITLRWGSPILYVNE